MIRTLIFDWDGTLHDTAHLYGCAFRSAYAWLVSEGYARPRAYSDAEVSVYLGMTSRDMWDSFMPQLPREVKEQASAIIGREMISAIRAGRAALYPGTEDMLDELKSLGFQLVILSNCKHEYMEAHRERFRLDRWFSGFYCSGNFDFAPKEEIVPVIQGLFPGRFAVIGDRDSDFRAAKAHQLPFIACAYGFGSPEEWAGADRIAREVSQLPALIGEIMAEEMN